LILFYHIENIYLGLILCVADESIDNNISLDESLVPLGSPPSSGSCNSPIEPTFINGRR
jgi:hypothetical protein